MQIVHTTNNNNNNSNKYKENTKDRLILCCDIAAINKTNRFQDRILLYLYETDMGQSPHNIDNVKLAHRSSENKEQLTMNCNNRKRLRKRSS